MSGRLRGGWWRCGCDVPCGCAGGARKRLRSPSDPRCDTCHAVKPTAVYAPDEIVDEHQRERMMRREQRRQDFYSR